MLVPDHTGIDRGTNGSRKKCPFHVLDQIRGFDHGFLAGTDIQVHRVDHGADIRQVAEYFFRRQRRLSLNGNACQGFKVFYRSAQLTLQNLFNARDRGTFTEDLDTLKQFTRVLGSVILYRTSDTVYQIGNCLCIFICRNVLVQKCFVGKKCLGILFGNLLYIHQRIDNCVLTIVDASLKDKHLTTHYVYVSCIFFDLEYQVGTSFLHL